MKNLIYLCTYLLFSIFSPVFAQNNDIAFLGSDNFLENEPALPGDLVYVPFQLADGKIFVNARLEGKPKTFMLDTGAPGLILNGKKSNKEKNVSAEFSALTASSETVVSRFEWAGMRRGNTNALVVNISHLEAAAGMELAGLIGYDLLKNAEVLFDYQNKQLVLSRDRKSVWHKDRKPQAVFNLEMIDHLPVLKVKIGDQTAYLGLDCGAESNLLDESFLKFLPKSMLSKVKKEKLVGMNRQEVVSVSARISDTRIQKESFQNMKYLFTDLSGVKGDMDFALDGLLGFPFFESAVISINYKKQKLYVW